MKVNRKVKAMGKLSYMLEYPSISLYNDDKIIKSRSRNNQMSADNQQERLNALWIVGFTDGEGCFHILINKIPEMSLDWQVLP